MYSKYTFESNHYDNKFHDYQLNTFTYKKNHTILTSFISCLINMTITKVLQRPWQYIHVSKRLSCTLHSTLQPHLISHLFKETILQKQKDSSSSSKSAEKLILT